MICRWLAALAAVVIGGAPLAVQADTEEWYAYYALGVADDLYDEPLDAQLTAYEAAPGVERRHYALDYLGFYYPLRDRRTIAGFVISATADRLADSRDHLQLNHTLYGGSVMHFFGREAGDGPFLRADLGMATLEVDSSGDEPVHNDSGPGLLVGGGYGIALSRESRLLIGLTLATHRIGGESYRSSAIRIGGLW